MKVAFDTNTYVDLCRHVDSTVELFESADAIVLPYVALAELRCGFAGGRRQADNERILRQFLHRRHVAVAYPDERTTHQYAEVYRQLRRQGTPIPVNDMWIAALALQHDLVLHSRDRHFDHLPQIVRV